jgi:hypothetical protein
MSLTAEFMQSVQILRQVAENDQGSNFTSGYPGFPTLDNVLAKITPLPDHGLFLGVASDGLPLLLNMKDPGPGPILILGDGQTGKTDFLQGVARAASLAHHPRFLRFAVVTPFLDEWAGWDGLPHCLGLWRPDVPGLKDLFFDLSARAQDRNKSEVLLLLVDDLNSLVSRELTLLENLHGLLANGAAGQVWTIATLNADQALRLPNWVGAFRTRIFGLIRNPEVAGKFTSMPGANLGTLLSGAQFCIRERTHWLRFWMPLLK